MSARRDTLRGLLWVSPWLLGFLAFLAVPAAMSLYGSFTDSSLLEKPVFVGLANYREMWGDALFRACLRNTGLYALGAVIGSTVISIAIAALLEQRLRGTSLVRALVFIPTLVPAVSACVVWLWLFNPQYGLFNAALARLGVQGPDWLGDPRFAMPSLIVMSFWVIGSAVIVYSAALKDVPVSLYEAAEIDGVRRPGRFVHVTLPMISPAILFNGVMSLIWSLQVFAAPYILTKGGPEHTTYSYSMYVYTNAFTYGRMGYASALAWVQLVITLLLTAVLLLLGRRFVFYRAA